MFFHNYNPLNNVALSTVVAVLPSIILLYLLVLHPHKNKEGDRVLGIRTPYAALVAALTAFVIAVFIIECLWPKPEVHFSTVRPPVFSR